MADNGNNPGSGPPGHGTGHPGNDGHGGPSAAGNKKGAKATPGTRFGNAVASFAGVDSDYGRSELGRAKARRDTFAKQNSLSQDGPNPRNYPKGIGAAIHRVKDLRANISGISNTDPRDEI